MTYTSYYNNLGINAFAISAVLKEAGFLTLPKIALILPLAAHGETIRKLSHGSLRFISFEHYIIENVDLFYNFNERYYASLNPTLNALQFLNEIDVITLKDDGAIIRNEMPFDIAMGKRAERLWRASANIASMLSVDSEIFYLNARIEL